MDRIFFRLLIFYRLLIFCHGDGDYNHWAKQLYNTLMTKHNANIAPQPLNGRLEVNITFVAMKIISLNSIDQTLTIFCNYRMAWNDPTLAWDRSNYSGISYLVLPRKLIWQPDIFAFNMRDYKELVPQDRATLRIDSNGQVNLDHTMIFTQVCNLDIAMFPFDNQTCEIKFASTTRNADELRIEAFFNETTYPDYARAGNGEWAITKMEANKAQFVLMHTLTLDVAFLTIRMKRVPVYYVMVIIIPTFLLVSVCILGIFGPKPESDIGPEKVPLAMATLMSMTVLLGIVAGSLPRSRLSLLGFYLIIEILVCASAALVLVLVSLSRTIKVQFCIIRKKWRKRKTDDRIHQKTPETIELTDETTPKFTDNSIPESGKFTGLAAFLTSWFALRDTIDQFLSDHRKRGDERAKKAKNTSSWHQKAAILNVVFCVIFETVNLVLLIIILGYWR